MPWSSNAHKLKKRTESSLRRMDSIISAQSLIIKRIDTIKEELKLGCSDSERKRLESEMTFLGNLFSIIRL